MRVQNTPILTLRLGPTEDWRISARESGLHVVDVEDGGLG